MLPSRSRTYWNVMKPASGISRIVIVPTQLPPLLRTLDDARRTSLTAMAMWRIRAC